MCVFPANTLTYGYVNPDTVQQNPPAQMAVVESFY